jgi:threonine aldolase
MKYSFRNDYGEIGNPEIIKILLESAYEQTPGYGLDPYTKALEIKFRELTKEDLNLYLVSAGTQTNMILIDKALENYEAVIAVDTGHVNVHETGAIEGSGHKILTTPGIDGKLTPEGVLKILEEHVDFHMVIPKLVYISNSTELGTVYRLEEIQALYRLCQEKGLYFYIDGARLASALASSVANYTLADIAKYSDAFYFGGTKNGILYGEALLIKNKQLKENFHYHLKNKGGMLAKSYVVAKMFLRLLEDDLYLKHARHANYCAEQLIKGLDLLAVPHLPPNHTNQIFLTLSNETIARLSEDYKFDIWSPGKKESMIRLVTSWATDIKMCEEFILDLKKILNK